MKKSLIALSLLSPLLLTSTASATNNQPLTLQPALNAFGNQKFEDCIYSADANMVELYDPHVHITVKQVIEAFQTYGESDGLNYMITNGFDGVKASTIIDLGKNTINLSTELANGGVQAWINFPGQGQHAVAIIQVTNKQIEFVSWGYKYWWSLKEYQTKMYDQYTFIWNGNRRKNELFYTIRR